MSKLNPTDIIEALIFAAEKPVSFKKLAQILELSPDATQNELDILREEKDRIGSLQLVEVGGGWQLVTKPQYSAHIRQLREVPRQKLSRAAFEVLAIVAYRQPCTRADIEGLRGVDCSAPVQFLLEKKLIAFAGRKETPGKPYLFATTPQFLDHFGLRDIADLPSLAELSELNEGSAFHDGDNLFNRGQMRTPEEAEAAEAATEEALPVEIAAAEIDLAEGATAEAAAEQAPPMEAAPMQAASEAEAAETTTEEAAATEEATREMIAPDQAAIAADARSETDSEVDAETEAIGLEDADGVAAPLESPAEIESEAEPELGAAVAEEAGIEVGA